MLSQSFGPEDSDINISILVIYPVCIHTIQIVRVFVPIWNGLTEIVHPTVRLTNGYIDITEQFIRDIYLLEYKIVTHQPLLSHISYLIEIFKKLKNKSRWRRLHRPFINTSNYQNVLYDMHKRV